MCRVEDHQHDKSSSSSTICSTTSRPPLAAPLVVSPLPANTSSTGGSGSYNDEISPFVHNGDNESTASAKREEYHNKNHQNASSILVTSTGGTVSHRRADAQNFEHKSVFIIKEGEHSSSYSNRSNGEVGPFYSSLVREDEGAGRDECYKNNVNDQHASFGDLNQRIVLLGLDISRFQDNVQFFICAGGVFVFTIAYGYLQELVSVHLFSRQYTLFLSTCQFAGYAFWSLVLIKFDKYSQRISSGCSKSRGKEHSNGSSWKDCFRNRFAQHGRYEVVERQHVSASGSLSIASTGSITSCSSSFGKSTVHDVDVDVQEEEDFHDKEKGLFSTNRQQSEMSSSAGRPSWMLYITLSIIRAIDVGMTNGAMRFINYPMKTLVKSSRVAFTMMCGIVIGKKRYTREQYIMVFMLVFGLCIFIHADMSTKDAVFHPIGLSMLAISLLCDGALANYSEQIMIKHNITQDEFQFSIYSISFLGMLLITIWSDEFIVGFSNIFLRNGTISEIQTSSLHHEMNDRDGGVFFWNAGRKAAVMILFTLTGLCGSSCNGAITKKFGALSMSITSTSRKACTLFISFMSFPSNKCTTEHLTGMTIFISALIMKSSYYPSGRTR